MKLAGVGATAPNRRDFSPVSFYIFMCATLSCVRAVQLSGCLLLHCPYECIYSLYMYVCVTTSL